MANSEQFRIDLLTENRLQKAYEQTLDEVDINDGKLVRVKEGQYDIAASFMTKNMKDEPLEKSIGSTKLSLSEIIELWKALLHKNLSLMLLDHVSGDIIGIRCISTGSVTDEIESDIAGTETNMIKTYLKYCCQIANVYEHFGITELIDFTAQAVDSKYRRRGYATQLMNAAIIYVRNLGFESVCIKGEGTSNFTKKIYEAHKFEILHESFYDDYKVDGKQVFCDTGEHKSVRIYGKCVK